MKRNIQTLLCAQLCLATIAADAQVPISINTTLFVGPSFGLSTISDTTWVGPSANVVLSAGKWNQWVKAKWISSSAVLSGSGAGEIIFNDPASKGMMAGPTVIDGNAGNLVTVPMVSVLNPSGLNLENIAGPPAGWPDVANSSTLKLDGNLNLAIDGANVTLGNGITGNLYFGANGIVSNYGQSRMVITNNSLDSYVIKDNSAGGAFVFPIGIQSGDYTPATVDGTDVYHVSVQNYAGSAADAPVVRPTEGMDRTWHMFADLGSVATLTLQHQPVTNGADYVDTDAFITHYTSGTWSSSATPDYVSPGIHTRSGVTIPASTGNLRSSASGGIFLSKTSDASSPLPVNLVSFNAYLEGQRVTLSWKTSWEIGFDRFEIEASGDGIRFQKVGTLAGKNEQSNYEYILTQNTPLAYYRLKMVDLDGSYAYSSMRVIRASDNVAMLFPNPASDVVVVGGLSSKKIQNIQVIDTGGITVYNSKHIDGFNIPVRHLRNGLYIFEVTMQDGTRIKEKISIAR